MVGVGDKTTYYGETSVARSLNTTRRSELAKIDSADFSWFHVKICIVAGIGFFTDAYGIFAITIALPMIGNAYGGNGQLNRRQKLALGVATPIGTLLGQLFFGFLADQVGRKKMYGVELIIIIIATFSQALAGNALSVNIIGVILIWRLIAGIGFGGDYPLSAVITSEFASTRHRGKLMVMTFSAQGWGRLTAALVGLICVAAYHDSIVHSTSTGSTKIPSVDAIWRLVVGLGCVPAVLALYFRLTIPETPRFTIDVAKNIKQASEDIKAVMAGERGYVDPDVTIYRANVLKASWTDFCRYFGKWGNFKVLLGTSLSWLAVDVAFYGLGLDPSYIQNMGFWRSPETTASPHDVYLGLMDICILNLVLSVAGLIPGYYATFFLIDKWGRKPIQFMGFAVLAILFVIIGFAYNKLHETVPGNRVFFFLYCLINFFQNFGPNSTSFIVPGECFPTRYRSTAHGISGATGKLGAVIAQVGFTYLRDWNSTWAPCLIFEIYAIFMIVGVFSTFLIPETKQKSLEELSNEDQE